MSEPDQSQNGNGAWHSGERFLQKQAGVSDRMAAVGPKVLRPFMPEQHRIFYGQLPFILAGVIDKEDRPWATILTGVPGFIESPDQRQLVIRALPDNYDPAFSGFRENAPIGLLGIELPTRRRNRANGNIYNITSGAFHLTVSQTMGNCPKYIQKRYPEFIDGMNVAETVEPETYDAGDKLVQSIISKADTFFVATYANTNGVRTADVSHRGGKPGFVRIDPDGVLTVPDFSGNLFFNTLGNIFVSKKAGLIFPDFETGDILQLSGTADVITDSQEIEQFAGAERIWKVRPEKIFLRRKALPLRAEFLEASPFLNKTGTWKSTD